MNVAQADGQFELISALRRRLRHTKLELNLIVQEALNFLRDQLGVGEAALFFSKEQTKILTGYMRLAADGQLRSFEDEYPVLENSILEEVITGREGIHFDPAGPQEEFFKMYVALGVAGQATGKEWAPGLLELTVDAQSKGPLCQAYAEELGEWIELALLKDRLKRQSSQISTFGELSLIFATSLRLQDRLRLILEGIQKLFGFDRIRLYLFHEDKGHLAGAMQADLQGRMSTLSEEQYPIDPAQSKSLVEVLLENLRRDPWSRLMEQSLANHDLVLYLPLKIQAKEIGVLAVDNILSQEPIAEDVRHFLQSFAGQLALAVDNARLFSEVERLSLYDPLTHLPNRRYFRQRFQEELYRSYRGGASFALCMMDLDFFKEINDTYGHQLGDRAIQCVGQAINQVIRQSDFAARWGGDEMIILLGKTSRQEVGMVASRILDAIRGISLHYPADPPKQIKVTASMGIAFYPQDGKELEELMANADKALYYQKFHGRNGFALTVCPTESSADPH